MQNSYVRSLSESTTRRERFFAHSFMILMTGSMIEDICSCFLILLGLDSTISNYVSWVINGMMMMYLMWNLLKKRKLINLIVVEIAVLLVVIFSVMRTPLIMDMIMNNITVLFITNIIAYFIGKYGFIKDSIYIKILAVAPSYIILGLIYITLLLLSGTDNYMNTSYNLLFVTCVCFLKAIIEQRVKYYFVAIVFLLYVLLFGASGVFLTLVIFATMLFYQSLSKKKKVFAVIGCIFVCIIGYLLYDQLLSMLTNLFPDSRTVKKIVNEKLTETPRFLIWTFVLDCIKSNPFKINGLFADRVIITYGNLSTSSIGHYVALEQMGGLYAHNVFLEVMTQFGVFIGLILILGFVHRMKKYKRIVVGTECNRDRKFFFLTIACIALIPLMVSNSYLFSFNFWLLAGLISSTPIYKKYNKKATNP